MKILLISGSRSNIGKSTLAVNIAEILKPKKVEIIKFGHGKRDPEKKTKLFINIEDGKKYIKSKIFSNSLDYLIVEGNSIAKYIRYNLLIFIKIKNQKISSRYPLENADIIIDENYNEIHIKEILKEKQININLIKALKIQFKYLTKFN